MRWLKLLSAAYGIDTLPILTLQAALIINTGHDQYADDYQNSRQIFNGRLGSSMYFSPAHILSPLQIMLPINNCDLPYKSKIPDLRKKTTFFYPVL